MKQKDTRKDKNVLLCPVKSSQATQSTSWRPGRILSTVHQGETPLVVYKTITILLSGFIPLANIVNMILQPQSVFKPSSLQHDVHL